MRDKIDILRMLNLLGPSQISKDKMSSYKYANPSQAYLYENIQLIPHRLSPKSDRLVWRREKSF